MPPPLPDDVPGAAAAAGALLPDDVTGAGTAAAEALPDEVPGMLLLLLDDVPGEVTTCTCSKQRHLQSPLCEQQPQTDFQLAPPKVKAQMKMQAN